MIPLNHDRRALRIALFYGAVCHGAFALGGLAMLWGLYTGLSGSFGAVPWPGAALTNAALLVQFPLAHSWLLTPRGQGVLRRLAPAPHGGTLVTTVFATIASVQLLALFTLWTPTGIVIWQATGAAWWAMTAAFAASWIFLTKASFDAGPSVQSGALGWMALARGHTPVYPDMPERGTFAVMRHPIYLAFALVLWTMPTWTADQLFLAVTYTAYCALGPRLKEARFERIFGDRFRAYRVRTPFWFPKLKVRSDAPDRS